MEPLVNQQLGFEVVHKEQLIPSGQKQHILISLTGYLGFI